MRWPKGGREREGGRDRERALGRSVRHRWRERGGWGQSRGRWERLRDERGGDKEKKEGNSKKWTLAPCDVHINKTI
jgi:hypothetical protein